MVYVVDVEEGQICPPPAIYYPNDATFAIVIASETTAATVPAAFAEKKGFRCNLFYAFVAIVVTLVVGVIIANVVHRRKEGYTDTWS